MTAGELLRELARLNIRLTRAGDKLRVDAPREALTYELCSLIRRHKSELLQLLGEDQPDLKGAKHLEKVRLPVSLQADGICGSCKQGEWWISRYGVLVCAICHAPASPELVRMWVSKQEAAELAALVMENSV
ncbi:MAG: hypothetical protein ACPLPR_01550 [Bacillota bacterium]